MLENRSVQPKLELNLLESIASQDNEDTAMFPPCASSRDEFVNVLYSEMAYYRWGTLQIGTVR